MATIVSIKQKIEQLDAGSFQVLCDAYLSREGYPNPVSLGTKAGTQKTTQGTPDTYFCLANGKYVLAEYTTQRPGLAGKIRSDLEKCFDSQLSGINNDDITEIIYCHTSSGIDAGTDKSLKRYCQDKGVQLTMIGIDKLAEDISRKYPILAKKHLGLSVDTEQIQVETLLLIKERIDNTEKVELSVDEIDVNEGKNYQSVDDELIVILGGFADTHNIESALDLFFDYYLKRPDLYIQFYHATNLYFGIKPSSLQKGFYTQIQLIQHFINYSDNWNNPFIRILFFETAKNLLQVYFSPAEAGRRGDSFVIYVAAEKRSQRITLILY